MSALISTPPVRRIRWRGATRIIASRFPPIHLYERVSANPAVWEALVAAEMLVNPRIRDEIGELHLVPPSERVTGPGATWVMAPFTHRNPRGSRFCDGSYGVSYAAAELATAVAETAHHFAELARESGDGPRYETMRVLEGGVDAPFHDIERADPGDRALLLDPNSYATSRSFGAALRDAFTNGIHYPSVRHAGGRCVGAFRPRAVHIPHQSRHLGYDWDGQRVRRYFDYADQAWVDLTS